jgi:hypothetical protein
LVRKEGMVRSGESKRATLPKCLSLSLSLSLCAEHAVCREYKK